MEQQLSPPPGILPRDIAEAYADCFKALADATRIQIVSLLAAAGADVTVGELTGQMGIAQSTVSHHLKALAQVGLVVVQPAGTSNLYRLDEACTACFPTAADVLTGDGPRIPS